MSLSLTSENKTVSCSKTNKPLWEVLPTGALKFLTAHGDCNYCGRWFSVDQMKTFTDYQIVCRISGLSCLSCYNRPLAADDELSNIKMVNK